MIKTWSSIMPIIFDVPYREFCRARLVEIWRQLLKRMTLGAQSAFAAPDHLVFAIFFCAPALC
jgi:hypothetical protein